MWEEMKKKGEWKSESPMTPKMLVKIPQKRNRTVILAVPLIGWR